MNIAHGEAYAIAGIVTAVVAAAGTPLWLALVAGIAAAVLFALLLERFCCGRGDPGRSIRSFW